MKQILKSTWLFTMASIILINDTLNAQVPVLLNYQGHVTAGDASFDGIGLFRFALVNATGTVAFWSNDGTHLDGSQPTTAVSIPVTQGLYSVLIGDSTIGNMTAIPPGALSSSDIRLRVWFDDGVRGPQLLEPDHRIAAEGYLADGSVTSTKLSAGAVTSAHISPGAVAAVNIGTGAVDSSKIANLGIKAENLANGSVTAEKIGNDIGFWSTTGVNVYRPLGYVGIGTLAPGSRLDVAGNDNSGAQVGVFRISREDSPNRYMYMGYDADDFGYIQPVHVGVTWKNLAISPHGGNVGIGTFNPGQKLTVAGTVESTSGGFRFPDGSVQGVAPRSGDSFVVFKEGDNVVLYETSSRRIAFSSPNAGEVLQQAHDSAQVGQRIVVNGDLILTSTVTITKSLSLEWNGRLYSRVPEGEPAFVIGTASSQGSTAKLTFGIVEGYNKSNDFIRIYNGVFNDISVLEANFFRYIFHFSPDSGLPQAQNLFRYTVLANSHKAFYFPSPIGKRPLAEGNQMMGGAIFNCDYGIHCESGADCGGMTVQGVIDNAEVGNPQSTRKDYWNESEIGNPDSIGSLLNMAFIRFPFTRLHPADMLSNAFGPAVFGLGGIELGGPGSNGAYLDFSRVGGKPDFDVRLINSAPGLLAAEANQFHVTGVLSSPNKQFRIDHPLDPMKSDLVHGTVESDEMKNLYDGVAELNEEGEAWVRLPRWFDALNEQYRYSLTPIGAPMPMLYIGQEIAENRFKISGGVPLRRVSWQVTGIRKDAYAKANPLVVEQSKELILAPVQVARHRFLSGRVPITPASRVPPLESD